MKGFWSGKTPTEKVRDGAYGSVRGNSSDPCSTCGLLRSVTTPRMKYSGEGRLSVLMIGESPDEVDDEQGIPFMGESGRILQSHLDEYSIKLHRDFWLLNAVNCRLPSSREPTVKEIKCCRPRVQRAIDELKPKFIWLVGGSALKSMYSGRYQDLEVERWHKLCIPDPTTNAWIIPIYHPSWVLRSRGNELINASFERDVRFAVRCLKKEPPTFPKPQIQIITEYKEVFDYLQRINKRGKEYGYTIAFDYETSNTKPYYSTDQKIWSCAICDDSEISTAFPISYTDHFSDDQINNIKWLLSEIHLKKGIGKIAHYLQFEDMWTREIIGSRVENWQWCTMNAAHVQDCRPSYCGLKFQSYTNFGIEDYGKEAKTYMESFHTGTRINKLDTFPLQKLLKYNAIDSWITWQLYKKQYRTFTRNEQRRDDTRKRAYETITLPGIQALSDATITGVAMDREYYELAKIDLTKKIKGLETELLEGDIATRFKKRTGRKLALANKDFSAADLRVILYDILKVSKIVMTATGMKAVNKEVMGETDDPWAQTLVEWRQANKMLGTYLAQFAREIDDSDRMHPLFLLHTTRSYRSSSTNPNFQNIPNRDDTAKALIRKGVIPSKGRRIGTVDLGSHEVRIAAVLSQDPKLLWYCSQPGSDMHMDIATRIWDAKPDLISKMIRYHSKSGFVFAEIYGSYYVNCAVNMWDLCAGLKLKDETPLKRHLKDRGIISGPSTALSKVKIRGKLQTVQKHLAQFIAHMKDIEDWFWQEFGGVREWQMRLIDTYKRKGYLEMPFGFRCTDTMTTNEIFNRAVQGTAFHILMWAFVQLNEACKRSFKTNVMGQIHDEIVFDIEPDELQNILDITEATLTVRSRKEFPWINVPLIVEPKVTEIDQSWYFTREMVRDKSTRRWVYK
jgi:uracil-DNA glycosylase